MVNMNRALVSDHRPTGFLTKVNLGNLNLWSIPERKFQCSGIGGGYSGSEMFRAALQEPDCSCLHKQDIFIYFSAHTYCWMLILVISCNIYHSLFCESSVSTG